MHGARSGRGAGETRAACCWKFANLAAISRPLWIRYRCRSSRTQPATPLAATLVVPSGRQPPLPSPDPLRPPPPHRVVIRDPRLTRARPLFSTRWSFVDAFLFVIPFVIPLPLFVARRRALLTLSLSDRESWPIKPAGGSFNARAGEPRWRSKRRTRQRNMRALRMSASFSYGYGWISKECTIVTCNNMDMYSF